MYVGAVFDGRWIYCAAYGTGRILRFDTHGDFESAQSWQMHDADGTAGLRTAGFDGAYCDGRFVYFVPFLYFHDESQKEYTVHGNFLRLDTTRDFKDPASWQARDASYTSGLKSIGFNAGAFDGRYFYGAPWRQDNEKQAQNAATDSIILRCDTLGENGSFSLRWSDTGHNGGLCAALPGPSFLVNLVSGQVLSVGAHKVLPPGRYHVAGIYDGQTIKLVINGEVVAERSGSGNIQNCDAPICVGQIGNELGKFHGAVEKFRISECAKNSD
jgi:hypothetical protein